MAKRKIKVVKRDAPLSELAVLPTTQTNPNREISNKVKDWISERRENSRSEKAASDKAVSDWRNV